MNLVESITLAELKEALPNKVAVLTEELVELTNQCLSDNIDKDDFLENLCTYSSVVGQGTTSIVRYTKAIVFCSLLESQTNNTQAYIETFKDTAFVKARLQCSTTSIEYRTLTSRASTYRRSPIVRKILTQSHMPMRLMFQAEKYKSIASLVHERDTAPYAKDRIAAADKILTHLKDPDNLQIDLEVGPNSEAKDLQSQLMSQLAQSAINQRAFLEAGIPLAEVQKLNINLNSDDVLEGEIENDR